MAKFKPFFEVELSKRYTEEERAAIAAEILNHIVDRTESGKDKDGDKFPGYEKKYSDLKGQSNVDLRLTGEMLESIELIKNQKGKIAIGYDQSAEIVGKVEGNCIGSYGQPFANPKKARNFLGIEEKELEKILKKYPLGKQNEDKRQERIDDLIAGEIVSKELLDIIDFDFGD